MHTFFGEGPDPTRRVTYSRSVGSIVSVPLIVTTYEIPILSLLFLLIDHINNIINLLMHLYVLYSKIATASHWQL